MIPQQLMKVLARGLLHNRSMSVISQWPAADRPRERLREKGARALGDAEILAVLLGTGGASMDAVELARSIIVSCGGLERLSSMGVGALAALPGIGEAKAARIVAAVELGDRIQERRSGERRRRRFRCSADIWESYRSRLCHLRQETILAVGLNNKNEPIREEVVAMGSVDECLVGPREVFRPMIAEAAARLVVLHNHPSGDPRPSPQDVTFTRRLEQAGELLGVQLLDHLVVGRGSYSSLRDLGLMGKVTAASAAVSHGGVLL